MQKVITINLNGNAYQIDEAGYAGLVEVEIFSAKNWWRRQMGETLSVCAERFATAT